MLRSTNAQIRVLLHGKNMWAIWSILMLFMLANFLTNIEQYKGKDILEMYHPMQLLTLTEYSGSYGFYLLQIFPILVVLPAGFSFVKDFSSGCQVYWISRIPRIQYFLGKIFAAIIVTTLVFATPFLVEILITYISFPTNATGNVYNLSIYDEAYRHLSQNYFAPSLAMSRPYVYAVIFTLIFGVVSGLLSAVVVALSFLFPFKFRSFLLFPLLFLFYGLNFFDKYFERSTINYMQYLFLFSTEPKSVIFAIIFLLLFLVYIVLAILLIKNEDVLI